MPLLLGAVLVLAAVWAVARRVDVRLVLTLTGIALAALADDPLRAVRIFLATFSSEQFVIPICTAMGFAYVLRQTECDLHLVRLLSAPVRRVRPLLVPGTVVIGFLVNIPIVSQTSTAVTVGPVLLPLLRAAGVSPLTSGAALLLGSSIGGELLNQGAPEYQTITGVLKDDKVVAKQCVARVMVPLLVHLAVATGVFWVMSRSDVKTEPAPSAGEALSARNVNSSRVNVFKALVPLVPVVLLFLTGPPAPVFGVDWSWLVGPDEKGARLDSRRIGAAMLVGVALAALTGGRKTLDTAKAFFDGAGFAFTHIVALIVAAACFGEGIKAIGVADYLARFVGGSAALLVLSAVLLPLLFAALSGSGFAATQSLFAVFVGPAARTGLDPLDVGAVVSLSAAAGRTASPVAAVTLMSASLTATEPLALARRVALPLTAGLAAAIATRYLLGY